MPFPRDVGKPIVDLSLENDMKVRIGLIEKLPSGRVLTQKGANHAVSCKIAVC